MTWTEIATIDRFPIERGVAARVDGRDVAIFRLTTDEWFALDNVDPFTGMSLLARGLVGSVGDIPTVAAPLYKQRFDLRTGECLDDSRYSVAAWPVRALNGTVQVAVSSVRSVAHHSPVADSVETVAA
jgi:nitrite reductase (NADH) small subunit